MIHRSKVKSGHSFTPFIASISRSRMDDGYFADEVKAACKSLNTRVRELVKAKTGDELDGARLKQRDFSVDNPIIRVSHDTQQVVKIPRKVICKSAPV